MANADAPPHASPRACPFCGGSDRALLYEGLEDVTFFATKARVTMFVCTDCGSGYLDPLPSDAVLTEAYSSYYTHGEEALQSAELISLGGGLKTAVSNGFKRARFAGSRRGGDRAAEFVTRLMPGKRDVIEQKLRFLPRTSGALMDFGCGNGEFLELAAKAGWTGEGLDFDAQAVEVVRQKGMKAEVGGVEALADRSGRYDAVTISHVVEHVPDPAALVRASFIALRPGGLLYIETPSMDALGREYWGRDWRGIEAPRHLSIATPRALGGLVLRSGFSDVRFHHLSAALRARYFRTLSSKSAIIRGGGDPEAPGSHSRHEPAGKLGKASTPSKFEFVMLTATKPAG